MLAAILEDKCLETCFVKMMIERNGSKNEEKRGMGVRCYDLGVRKGRSRKDKEGKRRGVWVGRGEKVRGIDFHVLWYNQEEITKKNRQS